MDLKIKDVADLLNVSETTVRRWLKDGKIPAYQLNRRYRFSRGEIEDWIMDCKLKLSKNGFSPFNEKSEDILDEEESQKQRVGRQQFGLYRAMCKGGAVTHIAAKTKEEFIKAVMRQVAPRLGLDADVISELLLDREKLMSTALNSGLAVPHPRDIVLELPGSDAVITAFPQEPIEFGALDGQPVHTLFFLFSSSDKTHLHLLSKLAHLGSQTSALEFLATRPSEEELLTYVKDWEAKIRNQNP
ncbi:PTS sugar transporter subunit IIA [Rhabdochlamydiaceae symbiont of Dictyostelium giganteum]|uniref:PTS sugar transporter subunit IIA n=1 Tax=Rhabdochlamydiaceae symbiont of Dictyostelium giganteum TaxID=3342349 RepID=UPI00384AF26C